jgi:hypothetical protein
MMATRPGRRRFVAGVTAGLVSFSAGLLARNPLATPQQQLFFSASDDLNGKHYLTASYASGEPLFNLPVPQRAHDILTLGGNNQVLFFSRRPGTEIYIVDLAQQQLIQTIKSPPGRHFYGHGVVSHDERFLFCSENDYIHQRGVIAVYDIKLGYQRIGEMESGGIGPHQLALAKYGKQLVVANGGILTHPDSGRKKLNLQSMVSSLAYIDIASGRLIDSYQPPHHQMSIRHLAISRDDQVVAGVQFQGPEGAVVPLVLTHQGEQPLQLMQADDDDWFDMNHYIASVAVDNSGSLALSTSPRGNKVNLWDLKQRRILASQTVRDVAGAVWCPLSQAFMVSNGLGEIVAINYQDEEIILRRQFQQRSLQWDNHLAVMQRGRG